MSVSISVPEDAHAYCNDCEWGATPDNHDYADVQTDATVHRDFDGHKVTIGVSEETKTEAKKRV